MICNRFDVVVVPFPFTDRPEAKKRPALVLSNRAFNKSGRTILSMITTRQAPPWPGDSPLSDYPSAGLHFPCLVRFKFFTLDNRLLLKKIGRLTEKDANLVDQHLRNVLL